MRASPQVRHWVNRREEKTTEIHSCHVERNALIQEGTEGGSDSEISRRRNITNEDGEGLSIQVQELDPMVWNPDSTDDEYEEGTTGKQTMAGLPRWAKNHLGW